MKDIGEQIRKSRNSIKMTQQELADVIGKSVPSIQKYEIGAVTPPLNVLIDIADALDVSIVKILKKVVSDDLKKHKAYSKRW